ncbi:enoyl-CoA hydratase/isomerase family protein [Desulfatitalea alkaliphila]|uniref:Enoyl-CoA hydratase-related protein n=1 Tax=Desulfatitalea alkaliphila TaxID=2929485 RepID=A0AA41R485_9BACT|nr:enoyl-CoA hydratase-related protein [Desulfatitalea alkaliphila]MCJ8500501.1 enoyl-CoA hydratase-related protein [Desulfatitalea alkaliphila]
MSYEHISVATEQGITTITFNRPKALNALNSALLEEFARAVEAVAADEEIRVLVLTGAGDKAFVAGADITELARLDTLKAKVFINRGLSAINALTQLSIPVIAAVNGFALGGGLEIAMACDFIYASEKASFGQPEIKLGLIPGYGGTQRLPRIIGAAQAKELLFTGKMISAVEALRLGIVNKVVAPEALMDTVMATAREMAAMGRVSVRAVKQAVDNGLNADLTTALRIETDAFALCMASPDAKEGTSAFLEKRKPAFTGKLMDE